jgi:hypothetical protein
VRKGGKKRTNLSKKGEEAFSSGVHENEFIFGFRIGAVGIEPEQHLSMGIVGDEAVAGEEDGGLADGEMGLSREAEFVLIVHSHSLVHVHQLRRHQHKRIGRNGKK